MNAKFHLVDVIREWKGRNGIMYLDQLQNPLYVNVEKKMTSYTSVKSNTSVTTHIKN